MFKNKLQILPVIIASLIFSLSAAANTKSDAVYKIAVKALSQKLQSDLAADNVNLKLEQVSRYDISKNETGFKGTAQANEQPISFDVKVNTLKEVPTGVDYDYVETASAPAESVAEDNLTKNLLAKLKQDYKTTNIVIALDEVIMPSQSNGKNIYKGSGEVRIGFDWQKIDYSVTLNPVTNKAVKVDYDIKK